MSKYGTIITQYHPKLNFGQTVEVLDFDKTCQRYIVRPHGQRRTDSVRPAGLWVATQRNRNDPAILRKKLDDLEQEARRGLYGFYTKHR